MRIDLRGWKQTLVLVHRKPILLEDRAVNYGIDDHRSTSWCELIFTSESAAAFFWFQDRKSGLRFTGQTGVRFCRVAIFSVELVNFYKYLGHCLKIKLGFKSLFSVFKATIRVPGKNFVIDIVHSTECFKFKIYIF